MERASSGQHLAVIGAGSWGSALAMHLARQGHEVRLWGRNPSVMLEMATNGCNRRYLPGLPFPPGLTPTDDLKFALSGAAEILLVVPSHVFSEVLTDVSECRLA